MSVQTVRILTGILVIQLLLVIGSGIYSGDKLAVFEPGEELFHFAKDAVETVTVESPDDSLSLAKKDGTWVLPAEDDFPADAGKIDEFLTTVTRLQKTWPVARSQTALKPLKVADDTFERKITFAGSEEAELATLYLGSSPGFKKVHARAGDSSTVYSVELATFELPASAEAWTDKEYLYTDRDVVTEIRLPGVTLVKKEKDFSLSDLAENEVVKEAEVNSLVSQATMLRYLALLGTTPPEGYGTLEKTVAFEIERKGEKGLRSFIAKGPFEESFYVLKEVNSPYYFKIAKGIAEKFAGASRAALVTASAPEAGSGEPAERATAADGDTEASSEQEAAPQVEN